jgi:PPP family 3-phenylpropionic acid transporter
VTFRYLGSNAPRYARVRVWGSVGFILAVLGLGVAVDSLGTAIILPVLLLVYLGIWLSSLLVADPPSIPHPEGQASILKVVMKPGVLAFLFACFLMQAGHGAYYAFYSIFMEQIGYSKTLIGGLWALGVVAEVVVFIYMHQLLDRFGARQVLLASFLLAVVRWVLIGLFPGAMPLMLLAQLLHAATFGTFHAAAIHLIHQYFVGRHQGRGQAIYSSVSFGAGGALGSLFAGMMWQSVSPMGTFMASALVAFLAWLISWWWGRDSVNLPSHI